jgi:hypothetical protein
MRNPSDEACRGATDFCPWHNADLVPCPLCEATLASLLQFGLVFGLCRNAKGKV